MTRRPPISPLFPSTTLYRSFSTRRVRPHEQTHSAPKADRLALLRATRTNLESIFLLAPDPDRALARALVQAASGAPAARAELEIGRAHVCTAVTVKYRTPPS